MPVAAYMAVADTAAEHPSGENASKRALDMLGEMIEPAVIAEEELSSEHMERLIKDTLAKINARLHVQATEQKMPEAIRVSLTLVIADRQRAYIGHAGTNRVYLLHEGRLYDLTPTGELSAAPPAEMELKLFSVPGEDSGEAGEKPEARIEGKGRFLGQGIEAWIGYNEVEIAPGDTIILTTDGLWSTVSEEEIVENTMSALNVQRSASQLTRLAFSRDSSDNATMVSWQYVVPGEVEHDDVHAVRGRERKATAAEAMLAILLVLVLCGIFAVGFAFGWRITDAFRKPAKEKKQATTAKKTEEKKKTEKKEETRENEQQTQPQQTQPQQTQPQVAPSTSTVKGDGVRMRATADTKGELVGLLRNGQTVTVLGQAMGADSKTWTRAKATVKLGGKEKEAEGYIRNDFLETAPGQTQTSTIPATR